MGMFAGDRKKKVRKSAPSTRLYITAHNELDKLGIALPVFFNT